VLAAAKAEHVGRKTVLVRIVKLIAAAQRIRVPIQGMADKVPNRIPFLITGAWISAVIKWPRIQQSGMFVCQRTGITPLPASWCNRY
jgi:cation transport ATPase